MGCVSSAPKQPRIKLSPPSQKCLILGAGYSGKTTCFKHLVWPTMKHDQLQSFSDCLLQQYSLLLQGLEAFDQNRQGLVACEDNPEARGPLLERLQVLWKKYGSTWPLPFRADRGEALFLPSNHLELSNCVHESAKYMMDRAVARLGIPTQDVSKQDVMNVRIRTTGIVEERFTMVCSDGEVQSVQVFDVGGPRNERKKWIHCFECISMIFFVVDLASYCHGLWEDESTCSLLEQLNLFVEINGSRWFNNTLFCIVFNHLDRFLPLVAAKPFNTQHFPDAPKITPGKEWEGVEYIQRLFINKWTPRSIQPEPFVVTTSLVQENPIFLHRGFSERNNLVITLVESLPALPAVLCSLTAEYAEGSITLITPCMADAMRSLVRRNGMDEDGEGVKSTESKGEQNVDMGGLTCQRHTYSPQDQVR